MLLEIRGGASMFLLTSFNMLVLVLLIAYTFYRLLKTKSILTLISFTLQLSALTIVLLSIINKVQTSNPVEVFYLFFGIVIPCCFVVYDYRSMIEKVKKKGSFEGFITVDKNIKEKNEALVEFMNIASNDDFVDETISELELQKEDLFKGIKKKLVKADVYYNDNDYEGVYKIYTSLVGLFGTSANLYFNYGNACFKKGLLNEALSHYRKVLELNEQLISKLRKADSQNSSNKISNIAYKEYLVYYNIGVTYFIMGNADFALENFEKALKINSSFDNAKEGIGHIFALNGRKSEAVKYYEDIISRDNNNYAVGLALGKLFGELDRINEAEMSFEKCIKLSPNKPEAYTELGKLLMSQKKYSEALKVYRKYIKINENDYNGHYNLAGCYYQNRDFTKSISEYQKAISLNPKSYNSLFNLALIYEEKQEYDRAIEYYKDAILIKIDFVDAYNNLGILFSKQQRKFEALATYSNGIKACPNNFKIYYNMGVVLFELRRYEDAADAFRRALEINSQDREVYYYLGASLTELKKYDDAIKAYKKALDEYVNEGELYYNIAAVYALMKKQDIATDNLRKAISLDPGIKEEVIQNRVFDYMMTNMDFVEMVSGSAL